MDVTNFKFSETHGRIRVIKCWFIACKQCVAEIPECNILAENYKERSYFLVSLMMIVWL
jgi:hypothetical protein